MQQKKRPRRALLWTNLGMTVRNMNKLRFEHFLISISMNDMPESVLLRPPILQISWRLFRR